MRQIDISLLDVQLTVGVIHRKLHRNSVRGRQNRLKNRVDARASLRETAPGGGADGLSVRGGVVQSHKLGNTYLFFAHNAGEA